MKCRLVNFFQRQFWNWGQYFDELFRVKLEGIFTSRSTKRILTLPPLVEAIWRAYCYSNTYFSVITSWKSSISVLHILVEMDSIISFNFSAVAWSTTSSSSWTTFPLLDAYHHVHVTDINHARLLTVQHTVFITNSKHRQSNSVTQESVWTRP